jgi:predicted dehydrogenase
MTNPIKIVVVGSGSIGKRHLRNVKALFDERADGSEVIACDVVPEALKFVEKEYGIRTTSNMEEAFQEADAVFICTPNHLHATQALQAVRAGCHVLVEKPLAHSMEHVDELLALAKEKGVFVTVGYMMRFYEPFLKLKQLLQRNAIGKIYSARVEFGFFMPGWRPTQDYRKNYGAIKAQGGGVILDVTHEINMVTWLFGPIHEVFCFAGTQSDLEIDTEDTAEILMKSKDGVIISLHLDYLQRAYSRNCKIVGEKGTIIWDFVGHELKIYNKDTKEWTSVSKEIKDFNEVYVAEEKHIIDCIDGKAFPEVTGEEGKEDVLIALASLESAETGKVVRL